MNRKIINFKCLTPLWTGDIDARSDKLQSSGIMGSLRWWTEAILRSLNMFVCDPSSDDRCPKEQRIPNRRVNLYCPACLIFGATGLRRLFRIEIDGGEKIFAGGSINIKPAGRNRGWFLGSGLVDIVELKIIPLSSDFNANLILFPLIIISKWAGFGAKTQLGYGVIKIEDSIEVDLDKFNQALEKIKDAERLRKLGIGLRSEANTKFPSLSEMFFAKIKFKVSNDNWWKDVDGIKPDDSRNYKGYINDPRMQAWISSGSVPIAPTIKNWLRFGRGRTLWKSSNQNQDTNIENWLFGTTGREKQTSKINISCAYRVNDNLWEFRIWGWISRWIPKSNNPKGFDRESFLNNLKNALNGSGDIGIPWAQLLGNQTSNHKLIVWREFNSPRDTIKPNETDINSFIQSLIVNNGGES